MKFSYGFFPGGDPRTFRPDPDASTEAEQHAWEGACWWADELESRGLPVGVPGSCRTFSHARHGKYSVGIFLVSQFGLGTYTYEDEEWEPVKPAHCGVLPGCQVTRCVCACDGCIVWGTD